jgi:exosortase
MMGETYSASRTIGRGTYVGAALVAAVFVLVYGEFLVRQVRYAITHQADWGHTLVIPLIAGYFVYGHRDRIMREGFRTNWFGLALIVIGMAWYVLFTLGPEALNHHNFQAPGVALTLLGLTILFCGFRSLAYLWFPLAYLCLFGQYISDRFMHMVTFTMQDIAAMGSWVALNLIGLDTDRSGNALVIWSQGVPRHLNIAEACSGMRMLMAFLALGAAMAYTGLPRLWQQVALVVLAVPTAIFVNILRVVTLGILSLYNTEFAAGDFHHLIGLIWLVPAFFIYLGLMWILRKLVVEEEATQRPAARPPAVRFASPAAEGGR